MDVPAEESGFILSLGATGEAVYGYEFTPTRDVHLTGAERVAVPDSFTVEDIYTVNLRQGR